MSNVETKALPEVGTKICAIIIGGKLDGVVRYVDGNGAVGVDLGHIEVEYRHAIGQWCEKHSFAGPDSVEVLCDEELNKLASGEIVPLPHVGDEVHLDIGPGAVIGPIFEQIGEVIAAWPSPSGRPRVAVKVTRSLSDQENEEGVESDDVWIGTIFIAVPPGSSECGLRGGTDEQWVARWPASERARELWFGGDFG